MHVNTNPSPSSHLFFTYSGHSMITVVNMLYPSGGGIATRREVLLFLFTAHFSAETYVRAVYGVC